MNTSTRRTRRMVGGGASGLIVVAALGGAALAAAEGTGYGDGLALAFSTISTTGFGPGPQTGWGLAITMMVFAAGAACWFTLLIAAFEIGLRRNSAANRGNGSRSVDDDFWVRPQLHRGRGGRG